MAAHGRRRRSATARRLRCARRRERAPDLRRSCAARSTLRGFTPLGRAPFAQEGDGARPSPRRDLSGLSGTIPVFKSTHYRVNDTAAAPINATPLLTHYLRWATLTLLPPRFVSSDWHDSESDLLFSVGAGAGRGTGPAVRAAGAPVLAGPVDKAARAGGGRRTRTSAHCR